MTVCRRLCRDHSLVAREASAQRAAHAPGGTPDWAFNIPTRSSPSAVRPEGIVRGPAAPGNTSGPRSPETPTRRLFPEEHPPAPPSVAGAPDDDLRAAACHLMSGQGHPESADLAGLRRVPDPADGLLQGGHAPRTTPHGPIAKTCRDEDSSPAAEYFAALKPGCG